MTAVREVNFQDRTPLVLTHHLVKLIHAVENQLVWGFYFHILENHVERFQRFIGFEYLDIL